VPRRPPGSSRGRIAERLVRDEAFGTYIASGFVSRFLEAYLERFPRERVRIRLFEEFQGDPAWDVRDLFEFLGVDPDAELDTARRHNRSGGTIGNAPLRRIWTGTALYREEIERLQELLDRDLSTWLDSSGPPPPSAPDRRAG